MAVDNLIIDQWSGFNHKAGMVEVVQDYNTAPAWVGDDATTVRRLNAYSRALAYLESTARDFIDTSGDQVLEEEDLDDHREYGDAAAIVQRIAGGVTGAGMTIAVAGADDPLPETPVVPPMPEEPAEGDPSAQIIYNAQLQLRTEETQGAVETWLANHALRKQLAARQDWLRDWADREGFEAKVHEGEMEHVVPQGDGLFVQSWDFVRRRVAVDVYPPSVYFPVLDQTLRGFPQKVHLAWEYVNPGDGKPWVRRITYELIEASFTPAYQKPEDPPANRTCVVTDASYPLDGLGDKNLWNMEEAEGGIFNEGVIDEAGNVGPIQMMDLMIDFIPIVHVPNTPSSARHFGRSALSRVAQLLDDIAKDDTDLQRAASLAGQPMIGVSGASIPEGGITVGPGSVVSLGEKGDMAALPMGDNIKALQAVCDDLRSLLSVNSQVPAGLIGRVDPSKVTSGLVLALSFTPFQQLIDVLRLVRDPKYALLLKMVQRIALVYGDEHMLSDPTIHPANLAFGSYMPQDLPSMVKIIAELLAVHGLSTNTAVRMLAEAGVPISDVQEELERIRSENADLAESITAATDNPAYGAAYLGIENYQASASAVDTNAGIGAPAGPPTITLG